MVGVLKDLCGVPNGEYTSEEHLRGDTSTSGSLGTGKKCKAKRETARVIVVLVQTACGRHIQYIHLDK